VVARAHIGQSTGVGSHLHLRAMTDADVPVLQGIHARATASSYGRVHAWLMPILEDPATPLEAADWTVCATDPATGRVLGYVAVTRAHIENLYIEPDAQGRGVGAELLAAVEARVATRPLTLRCLHANPGARRFYEKHGFALVRDEVITYHGVPLDAWLLAKDA
jgi:ribosomal protein S18 acetylase RimI-like enzyme